MSMTLLFVLTVLASLPGLLWYVKKHRSWNVQASVTFIVMFLPIQVVILLVFAKEYDAQNLLERFITILPLIIYFAALIWIDEVYLPRNK